VRTLGLNGDFMGLEPNITAQIRRQPVQLSTRPVLGIEADQKLQNPRAFLPDAGCEGDRIQQMYHSSSFHMRDDLIR
jgi:hypothetical protein